MGEDSEQSYVTANVPPSTGPFVCPAPACGRVFIRPVNLSSAWSLDRASYTINTSGPSLADHLRRSHKTPSPFTCTWPGCDKEFVRQQDLTRHQGSHCTSSPSLSTASRWHLFNGAYGQQPARQLLYRAPTLRAVPVAVAAPPAQAQML